MLFIAIAALAQVSPLRCASGGPEAEIIACAERDERRADDELNRQWPLTVNAVRRIDAAAYTAARPYRSTAYAHLLKAQRTWLAFRDAECSSEADQANGGVDGPVVAAQCWERLTRVRTRELIDIAHLS